MSADFEVNERVLQQGIKFCVIKFGGNFFRENKYQWVKLNKA